MTSMFEHMLARRRLRSAARLYARRLGPQLVHDYGASEHYTLAQVRASVERAALPAIHIDLGYAAFLPEESFKQLARPANVEDYHPFKRLMAAYKPKRQPAWSPESAGSLPASSGEF